MVTGIYALYWEKPDLIYIGQSINVYSRFNTHLYKLKTNTHSNYKVQNTYNIYGAPEFILLEKTELIELDHKEEVWTAEFDSLTSSSGLNIIEPGKSCGWGTNSSSSKYTKRQILSIFSLLYKGKITNAEIAKRLKVNIQVVGSISQGFTHTWLSGSYPKQYSLMKSINRYVLSTSTKYRGTLVDSNNITYDVYNITEFCRIHTNNASDQSGISNVLNGKQRSCKGFKLHTEQKFTKYINE
jgi:hypothetical protein